jgi:hypothetical protein
MIFKCLATGSDGNAYLLESESSVLIIEAGKGTFKNIMRALPLNKKLVGVLYSHQHSDHFGDVHKFANFTNVLTFDENEMYSDNEFTIKRFPVRHSIECYGFVILCEGKYMMFVTDFNKVLNKEVYNLHIDFLAIELSYNQHIYNKMSNEDRFGLEFHSSDFHTFAIIDKYRTINPALKVATLHKSDRACNYGATNVKLFEKYGVNAEMVNLNKEYKF